MSSRQVPADLQPSRLDGVEQLTPEKLKLQLRRAARLKPRGKPMTKPKIPPDREDSFRSPSEGGYVSRTAAPKWIVEDEDGLLKLAVDKTFQKKIAPVLQSLQVSPDATMPPPSFEQPFIFVARPTCLKQGPHNCAMYGCPTPRDLEVRVEDLLEVAGKVMERHGKQYQQPAVKKKEAQALVNHMTRRKKPPSSPLRESYIAEEAIPPPAFGLSSPILRESSEEDFSDTIVLLSPPHKDSPQNPSPASAPSQLISSPAPVTPISAPTPISAVESRARRTSTFDFLEMMNSRRMDEAEPLDMRRRSSIAVGDMAYHREHPHMLPLRQRTGSLRRTTFRPSSPLSQKQLEPTTGQFIAQARMATQSVLVRE